MSVINLSLSLRWAMAFVFVTLQATSVSPWVVTMDALEPFRSGFLTHNNLFSSTIIPTLS